MPSKSNRNKFFSLQNRFTTWPFFTCSDGASLKLFTRAPLTSWVSVICLKYHAGYSVQYSRFLDQLLLLSADIYFKVNTLTFFEDKELIRWKLEEKISAFQCQSQSVWVEIYFFTYGGAVVEKSSFILLNCLCTLMSCPSVYGSVSGLCGFPLILLPTFVQDHPICLSLYVVLKPKCKG